MPSPCRLGPGRTCRETSEGTLQNWRTTWRSRWTRCSRRGSTWSPQILARTGETCPTRWRIYHPVEIEHLGKLQFMKTSSPSLSLLSRDCCVWQPVRLQYSRQYPQYPIIISNCNSWKLLSSRGWGWRTVDRRGSLRTTTRRRMGGAGSTSLTICNTFLMVGLV